MRSRGLMVMKHQGARKVAAGKRTWWNRLAATGDGGDQEHAIAFFEGAGFAAQETDVFLVEVDVEELANLALIVADVAREIGKARSKLVEGVGNRGRATVHFWRPVRETAEGCGAFDGYGHSISPSATLSYDFALSVSVPSCPSR